MAKERLTKKLKLERLEEEFNRIKERFIHGTTEAIKAQEQRLDVIKERIKKLF